ncbi:SsrA-binding protein SmpB [Pseudomonas fluorescens]|uniref:SsrA-binding protein SmpB n=1 Tax=Pseudomonas TaxID=286 RepID=UPI000F03891A|nr:MULTISPECIES: SsrA-binding protein SmpB [Pseudomonas]MBD8088446.1 SsrA-binding protein SmpB [Pseudomonas fluorescens]MBD8615108.1 SsrA-binding protein SmpB [Pseudomonas putida]MBD8681217.1 SsrA-binding protein SmpB [Pseudomonas sp. CFBP 13719]
MTTIAQNRKARHDYAVEQKFQAGIALEGWEVKSLRAGKAQLTDSYVLLKGGEAFIIGLQIQPLQTASTHVQPDPLRTRKLLLNRKELDRLVSSVEQKGYTAVVLSLEWSKHLVKCTVALAKGKKNYEKRETLKERDAKKQIDQALKQRRAAA